MDLTSADLAVSYRAILDQCEPFLITYPANRSALNLAPYGITISEERLYTATSLRSRDVVDGLHALDAATFGDKDMRMPRWVLFDCGEFPGIVFGFGRRARELSSDLRTKYGVDDDETFVPLSMWVAIRCAEEGAWFGHNLSSVNVMASADDTLKGLATLTKAVGVKVTRATKQYGATQWSSPSIGLHLKLGEMHLLSAYTPAHTHPETLAYRVDVDHAATLARLSEGARPRPRTGERIVAADDRAELERLQRELERGDAWILTRAETPPSGPQRLHLVRGS